MDLAHVAAKVPVDIRTKRKQHVHWQIGTKTKHGHDYRDDKQDARHQHQNCSLALEVSSVHASNEQRPESRISNHADDECGKCVVSIICALAYSFGQR